mgnify:CR=1 FL=1
MFDTHCHLNFSAFNGILEEVISEAKKAGVEKIVVPGTDVETSIKAVEIAQKFDGVYAAVGIHPHHVKKYQNEMPKQVRHDKLSSRYNKLAGCNPSPSDSEGKFISGSLLNNDLKKLEKLLTHPKVVAIGEIGLDRYIYQKTKYENYQIDERFIALQKEVFLAQLNLAKKYKKTVIIHNRQAKDDLLSTLANNQLLITNNNLVFHCCEPDFDLLNFAKKHHIYIGVDGDVTYDEKKQEFVKKIPLSLLVLETDSPFLMPKIQKKTVFKKDCLCINTPKNLVLIVQKVAEIKEEKVEKIIKKTKTNAIKLFMIS